ncbi:hypothetical protein AB3X52_13115 [Nocardioides sp. DS6]|uniref:Bacterial toxin 24 domain-containing protein n=1 Tax=Nocardioides eburneus TaxID=3231482 RepID=A0ABV3T1A8_9ACTN
MVERSPGPFAYFQDLHGGVNGDTIRADAYGAGLHAGDVSALASQLEGDSRTVARQLDGQITSLVQLNTRAASGSATRVAARGHYAVALLGSFAGMVDLFDITVNSLNHRYRSDLASAMRWSGKAASETPSKKDDQLVDEAHLGPSIKAALKPEYQTALRDLDDNADAIARKFREGPTVDNVRALVRAGLIPLHAESLYPGLHLTDEDRAAYFYSLAYLPSAPDPDEPDIPDEDVPPPEHHWWQTALDGLEDAGAWTYNHTVVPGVNGLADVGQAVVEHPGDLLSMLAGAGLMVVGSGGEAGGGLLDATGVGAVAGVPINVAAAAVIASGGTLAAAGGADLAHNAAQNHNTVLNEAHGAGRRPGDPLPDESRPSAAGSDWKGRVANNGNGDVWQAPGNVDAPRGSPRNANVFRDCDPDPDYPNGYVRFYNEHGQPLRLDGKPGSDAQTHIPKNPDGSYPVPEGWNP